MNEAVDGALVITGRSSCGAVGAALGVLMARHGIGVHDAFELLVRAARRSGLELRDVAVGIVRASERSDRRGPRGCASTGPCRRGGPVAAADPDPAGQSASEQGTVAVHAAWHGNWAVPRSVPSAVRSSSARFATSCTTAPRRPVRRPGDAAGR